MKLDILRTNERGHLNFGWLDTYHSFSFGEYQNRKRMNFGALRVINDDTIAPQSMFPPHSHHDMEIITIVLAGSIAADVGFPVAPSLLCVVAILEYAGLSVVGLR